LKGNGGLHGVPTFGTVYVEPGAKLNLLVDGFAGQWDRELGLALGTTWSRIFVLGWSEQRALNKNE
jgi:hypothetical protein